MTKEVPSVLTDLPKSAQHIWQFLRQYGPHTTQEIWQRSETPPRTTRYALAQLREYGLLDERPSLEDTRRTYYSARDIPKTITPRKTTL